MSIISLIDRKKTTFRTNKFLNIIVYIDTNKFSFYLFCKNHVDVAVKATNRMTKKKNEHRHM